MTKTKDLISSFYRQKEHWKNKIKNIKEETRQESWLRIRPALEEMWEEDKKREENIWGNLDEDLREYFGDEEIKRFVKYAKRKRKKK